MRTSGRIAKGTAVVVAGLALASAALAFWVSRTAGTATTPLAIGGINGSVGHEGWYASSCNPAYGLVNVEADYGFHCLGSTCMGQDAQSQDNDLKVVLWWEPGDPPLSRVGASAALTTKRSSLVAIEGDCEDGPPTFAATCLILLREPGVGATGSSVAGTLAESLSFQGPQMSLYRDASSGGAAYQDEAAAMPDAAWNPDPDDPDSWSAHVQTTCEVDVAALGIEILVPECYVRARAKLKVRYW